jgi:hypothetical protein
MMQTLWDKHPSFKIPGMCRIMIEKEVCLCSVLAVKEEFGNEVKSSKITEV